jgi:hypothetical protein
MLFSFRDNIVIDEISLSQGCLFIVCLFMFPFLFSLQAKDVLRVADVNET